MQNIADFLLNWARLANPEVHFNIFDHSINSYE